MTDSRREDQRSISVWAEETFGVATSNVRTAARANEEMAELIRALSIDDSNPDAITEIADVVIVLYRLADRMGVDLHAVIDAKMQLNRSRVWESDGSGHGKHVRSK